MSTIRESEKKVTLDQINTVLSNGKSLASAIQTVMDEDFIKRNRHDWFWVNGYQIPKETGWFRLDRIKSQLAKIDSSTAKNLKWHERMYVYESGHAGVREDLPLALYIGDEYEDGRLSALYLCGPDTFTRAALVEK